MPLVPYAGLVLMPDFDVRYSPTTDPDRVTHRLIRNPNYGGAPTVVPGACVVPVIERKIKPKFFVQLRKNVEENGFRNPIVLYNTPEGLLLSFGGSRLRVAKELGYNIPAIVVDYTGWYAWCSRVTPENCRSFFMDEPALFEFTETGVETHYSLERARRDAYDPAGMAWTKDVEDTRFLNEEFEWLND